MMAPHSKSGYLASAVERAERYRQVIGISADTLVELALAQETAFSKYRDELLRIQAAATEVGLMLPTLPGDRLNRSRARGTRGGRAPRRDA